jgi:hypothetical protein
LWTTCFEPWFPSVTVLTLLIAFVYVSEFLQSVNMLSSRVCEIWCSDGGDYDCKRYDPWKCDARCLGGTCCLRPPGRKTFPMNSSALKSEVIMLFWNVDALLTDYTSSLSEVICKNFILFNKQIV